jgi:hypothetical protein
MSDHLNARNVIQHSNKKHTKTRMKNDANQKQLEDNKKIETTQHNNIS